MLAAEP